MSMQTGAVTGLILRPAARVMAASLLMLGHAAHAAPLTLASGGKTAYVISLPSSATPGQTLAGEELAAYLRRISGASFRMVAGERPPEQAIVLGRHVPGGEPETGESYRLAARGRRIYLAGGRDRALLYAAYDLLGRLGCRWLAPQLGFYGGAAEAAPKSPELRLDLARDVAERPQLAFRKLYVEEGHSHNAENLAQLIAWMPKLRYNTLVVPADYQGRGAVKWDNWREAVTPELQRRDLTIEVGGHGYQNFLNAGMEDGKLFEQHPEWFGQDRQGTRRREPAWVFCTSNADARAYLIRSFLEYVRARPEIQIYDFWPPDGARWCECEKCRALGTPSDRQALLLNEVRETAAKVRPDLRLEVLAYQTSVTPPERVKLDSRILLDFCPINQCFEKPINDPSDPRNAAYAAGLQAWRKAFDGEISIYSYYRKYAWKSLPVIIPAYIQRDLAWYRNVPTQGISTYAEPGDWGAYELNHYVLGRLAWDPAADVSATTDEFCTARYGPAAPAARRALERLGEALRSCGSIPNSSLKTPEQIGAARAAIEATVKEIGTVRPADPGTSAALRRLGLCCEYARRDLAIQEARAGNATADARKQARELAAFLAAHPDDGVLLLHSRTEAARLLRSYGLGRPAAR